MISERAAGRDMTMRLRSALFALVGIAEKTLTGEIRPLEAATEIAAQQHEFEPSNDDLLLPFVGVDSECDNVKIGDRSLWSPDYLADRDRRYADLEADYGPFVLKSCAALLEEFRPKLLLCPVCGFRGSVPPFYADGTPSYEECACCGFAFYEHLAALTDEDFLHWRRRWIRAGMPFRQPPPPAEYDPHEQMRVATFGES